MRVGFALQQARQAVRSHDGVSVAIAQSRRMRAAERAERARLLLIEKKQRKPQYYDFNAEKKRDDNLRQAINLYHLSDTFFPTKAQISNEALQTQLSSTSGISGTSSDSDQTINVPKNKKQQLDDTLDSHIRTSIMGLTTPTSSHSNLDSSVEFMLPHQALASKIKTDEIAFGSGLAEPYKEMSTASMERLSTELFPPQPKRQRQSNGLNSFSSEPMSLPPVEDKEAVKRYIAENIRRKSLASRTASGTSSSGTDILDVRGAQVRDALYGTVGIKRPGLEVLRDRILVRKLEQKRSDRASGKNQAEQG